MTYLRCVSAKCTIIICIIIPFVLGWIQSDIRPNAGHKRFEVVGKILDSFEIAPPAEWIEGICDRHPSYGSPDFVRSDQNIAIQWHNADILKPVSIGHGKVSLKIESGASAAPFRIRRYSLSQKSEDWSCEACGIGDGHRSTGPQWHKLAVVFSPSGKYFAVFGMTFGADYYVQVFSLDEGWPHFHVYFSTWDDLSR